MVEPINLNRARKDRAKAQKAQSAQANRARFGRTPLQKALDAAQAEITAKKLDAAKRDDR